MTKKQISIEMAELLLNTNDKQTIQTLYDVLMKNTKNSLLLSLDSLKKSIKVS